MYNSDKLNSDDIKLAENLGRFHERKLLSLKIQDKFCKAIARQSKRERICECGDYLKFSKYQHKDTAEQLRQLSGANFCDFRFCPMCSWRKAREVANEAVGKIKTVSKNHNGVAFLFLTLTIKNPRLTELRDHITLLSQSFVRLKRQKAFQKAVLGYVRAIEFMGDHTPSGQAHPHYHCLLVVRKSYFKKADYITHEEWVRMWQKALKVDYEPTVRIQRVKPKVKLSADNKLSAERSAILEVVKYSVSFSDMNKLSDKELKELFAQTKGVRQYDFGGEVKDAEPSKEEQFDPDLWELLGEEIFKWKEGRYNLQDLDKNDLKE